MSGGSLIGLSFLRRRGRWPGKSEEELWQERTQELLRGQVREISTWLMSADRMDDIPGARDCGLANPLWDAGVKLAERYGVEL